MNEHDMIKFYVKHQVNRYVSAAILAFGRKIDALMQKGESVKGRTFAVKYRSPNEIICHAIGQVFSNSRNNIASYVVEGNIAFLQITCTVINEPKDLGMLQAQEKARIEDTFAQDDETASRTDSNEAELEVLKITKEDIDAERTVH